MLLLAVLVLGASWFMVSRLNAVGAVFTATDKNRNAAVLNLAKQTLVGYVALQASKQGEDNPGRLPCPEAPGNVGGANEGIAAASCTLPAVGRLPWRTLGLDELVDANSEPLWYVVSPGWAITAGNLVINSNTLGQLNVDGQANAAVALIIAPGAAMNVQASAGCTARNQTRATPSPTIDARDYIECFNTGTSAFSTTAPTTSFNDQVVRITIADVMPAIEAAIAHRIERDIVPVLKSVYGDATWGTSSTNPAFAFAAPFANPTTSSYLGQISPPLPSLYQGLLPFNYHSGSCGGDVRCSTDAITWNSAPSVSSSGGPGYLTTPTSSPSSAAPICSVSGSTPMCEGYYYGGALNISMTDALTTQITNGLRTFTLADHIGTFQPWRWTGSAWVNLGTQSATVSRSLASDGTARFIAGASLPSVPTWGYFYIYGSRPTISDHSILSSDTAATGWFVRNEWYRLVYYAIAPNHAAGGTLSCTTGGTCLSVVNMTPAGAQRAILILAGRSINGTTRPSATLGNYLEFGNATGAFERQPVSTAVAPALKKPFNDRVIVIDSN